MTHLTELAEHLASRRLGEGDWDNVSLVAEWLVTSLKRCGLSLTSQPDAREALAEVLAIAENLAGDVSVTRETWRRLREARTILGQDTVSKEGDR